MPVLYFDTCALAKRYYQEPGHKEIKKHIGNSNNRLVFRNMGITKMSSVLHKKIRKGDLTDNNGRLRLARFILESDQEYDILPTNDEFLNKSLGYVRKHDLRTLDAIHFATAKQVENQCSNFVFVSADSDLIDAAKKENMNYLNPDPNCS